MQEFIVNNVENVPGFIKLLKSGFVDKNNIDYLTKSDEKINSVLIYENEFSESDIYFNID